MALATCETTSATASSKRCIYTALVTDVELCPSAFEMLNIGTFYLLAQPVERDRREALRGDELRDALAQNVRLIRLSRLVDGDVALGVIFRVLLPPPFPVAVQPFEQRSQSSTKTSPGALLPPSSCVRRYSAMTCSACSIVG